MGWKIVGSSYISNKDTGEQVLVNVEKKKSKCKEKLFRIVLPTIEKTHKPQILGEMTLDWYREKNGRFRSQCTKNYLARYPGSLYYYGPIDTPEELEKQAGQCKVYVDSVDSDGDNKKYRGIGTTLMQVAIEISLSKKSAGKVVLDAASNSHGFYYKLGLRSWDVDIASSLENDERIEEELAAAKNENREPDTGELRKLQMYLPQEAIEKWKANVKHTPILNRTKKSLG